MEKDIRIAAVSCRSVVGRTDENLGRMRYWTAEAEKKGVDLVCFPELNITGYHVREPMGELAEPIDGPSVQAVKELARRYRMGLVAGLAERDASGRIYATQFLVDENGICGIYRKVHLGPPEIGMFTPADRIPPLAGFRGARFGIQLCYDAHFPEFATSMALQGADAILIPHASPANKTPEGKRRSWMRHLPARAYDNSVFILAVNPAGDNGRGINFPSISLIFSPAGEVIAGHAGFEETATVADLKVDMLREVRNHRMRYFFPHRRPELYHISDKL